MKNSIILVLILLLLAGTARADELLVYLGPKVCLLGAAIADERWYYVPELGLITFGLPDTGSGPLGADLNLSLGGRFATLGSRGQARTTAHLVLGLLLGLGGSFAVDLFPTDGQTGLYAGPDVVLQAPIVTASNGNGEKLPVVGMYYRYEMPLIDDDQLVATHGFGLFIGSWNQVLPVNR